MNEIIVLSIVLVVTVFLACAFTPRVEEPKEPRYRVVRGVVIRDDKG